MYTQCPDCGTPFRVTAEVLKQAAGKVRCGGCSNAFNALEFLSETIPQQAPANDSGPAVPELQPELLPDPAEMDSGLPKSISAEQSAALLKTLDQLAGSDIRIEDTGVEWRVLDDDVTRQASADDIVEGSGATPHDANKVDEILEAAPTPVDELLAEAPDIVEAEEIFDEASNTLGTTPVDEIRFDDNTPLPDDFDLDDESSYVPAAPDLTVDAEPEAVAAEPEPDITLTDPSEWDDIMGEFAELREQIADDARPAEEVAAEDAAAESNAAEVESHTASDVLDIDTQFSLQAEAMGIDLSGMHALDEAATQAEDAELLEPIAEDTGPINTDEIKPDEIKADEIEPDQVELDVVEPDEPVAQEPIDAEADEDESVSAFDAGDAQLELIEEPIVEQHSIEDELAALEAEELDGDEGTQTLVDTSDVESEPDSAIEHIVAPLSDEEQSVNMMIDRELMALAVEDKDGFASTIIIPEDAFVADNTADSDNNEDNPRSGELRSGRAAAQAVSAFETIVMEGESVQSESDSAKREAERAAVIASLVIAPAEEAPMPTSKRKRYSIIGGIAALILLLLIQAAHQFRERLATVPAINSVIAPIYLALGQPLQPEWDIKGWRFEATKGNTDLAVDDNTEADNEQITIYSRVGNKSAAALPYPLIGISLTDRFEETIGSRILEPAEYLPDDVDPRKLVKPGDNFNAVISIHTPSKDTTGFKLNVCYRMSDNNLRCAIEDFK